MKDKDRFGRRCCGLNRKGTGGRMVYAGIIALIFIGELFIKNHVEKTGRTGKRRRYCRAGYC